MEATQTFQTLGFLILLATVVIFTLKVLRYENKTDFFTWIVIGLLFTSCEYIGVVCIFLIRKLSIFTLQFLF